MLDETFDAIYPDVIRRASAVHWTPVRVCARIVKLLALSPSDRLVDVGAGAGKLCIVASAMSGAHVRGIERVPALANVAREAARRLGVDVEIVDGGFDVRAGEDADVVYMFNPFFESIPLPGAPNAAMQAAIDIAAAEELLGALRKGARVVTFCGFGGDIPTDYHRLARERWDGGALEVWEKR
ncbi:MAG: hypothetical protein KIT84_16470 [Labilithrix sp.]|nr:hypothetical protein [Labilithrix sp.]MCW5812625.1 hypothetical protein [Labilithrix sp.]